MIAPLRRMPLALCLAAATLAGCDLVTPQATSGPTASSVASTPRPPTPKPTKSPADKAIEAFVAKVTRNELSYEATFTGRSRHAADILPARGSIEVSGRAYRLSVSFMFPDTGNSYRVEHRFVGGDAWILDPGSRWRRLKGFLSDHSMSPFSAILDETDVKFIGAVKGGGRYRIEVPTTFFHPALIPAINLSASQMDDGTIVLLIDENGRPLSGESELKGSNRVSGQLQEVIIETTLTFTRVGDDIRISAP
jgi:hypothetical protein